MSSPWLALYPSARDEKFKNLHLTLADFPNLTEQGYILDRLNAYMGPVGLQAFSDCLVNGKALFYTAKGTALVHLVNDDRLYRIRHQIVNDFLKEATCEWRHCWVAHMTVSWNSHPSVVLPVPRPDRVTFDRMCLHAGNKNQVVQEWQLK